jgi:hypothetical protein
LGLPWISPGRWAAPRRGFALDSGTRQLLRGGEEVHLSPKAFELR